MNRTEILQTATEYINKDRAATHGDAEDSFTTIAELWATYLDLEWISASDVAMMMVLFKVARFKNNPTHTDNTIDMAGYAALAGEIAQKEDNTYESAESNDGEPRPNVPVCDCASCAAERYSDSFAIFRV